MLAGVDTALMSKISGFIAERMGLHFPEERWPDLARILKTVGHELGFEDSDSVSRWLTTSEPTVRQIEMLASHLTVGETHFYRDPASFDLLEREILPSLVARRAQTGRTLRLWSAGCCTGEEAYSLAIACARAVPDLCGGNISILATDINPDFLSKAEEGVYSKWSFRGTPGWVSERFFSPAPGGKFAIDTAIKHLVHFSYLNLATDSYPSLHNNTNAMDVIFCRNVLMYFTPAHQRKVIAALHGCLVDGGYLVVNPAEANSVLFPMFAMEHRDGIILYRKLSQPTHSIVWPSSVASPPVSAPPVFEPAFFAEQESPAPAAPSIRDDQPAPQVSFETAARLFSEGNYDAAAAQLTRITQVEPGLARAPLLLARIYANQGRLDEALIWCQQAAAAERTNPAVHFLCATICHELGRLQEAIAAFGKVLYLDQDYILAHHALGVIYKRLGKQKESRRHLSVALKLLSARSKDEILPESEGMTCGRLVETVRVMKGDEPWDHAS